MPIIKTKEFILRPYKIGDEFLLCEQLNDREIARNMIDVAHPYSLKMARVLVKRKIREQELRKPREISFVIDVNGKAAGGITFDIKPFSSAEISFWLGRKYRGKGIAASAVRLAADYCFKKFNLVRAYALIFPWNKASVRAVEKAGFRYEGCLRKNSQRLGKGKFFDDLLYAKVR